MKTIEEIDTELKRLGKLKEKLAEAQRKEENSTLIGKCFRYRNSFGGPEPRRAWWLFMKITSMDKHGWLSGVKAQCDCDGRVNVESDSFITCHLIDEGHKPISEEAWAKAVDSILAKAHKALRSR